MNGSLFQCTAEEHAAVLNALREALEARDDVVFAYVHGSFLADRPFRDIDVAVYLDPTADRENGWSALDPAGELEGHLAQSLRGTKGAREPGQNFPVDVRVLNQAPLGFRYHAYRGKMVFCRDDTLRTREVEWTVCRYLDLKPLRRQALKEAMTTWV